ncbi:hypothetical protein Trydic_g16602 [Trypoxylus dichotomus]
MPRTSYKIFKILVKYPRNQQSICTYTDDIEWDNWLQPTEHGQITTKTAGHKVNWPQRELATGTTSLRGNLQL